MRVWVALCLAGCGFRPTQGQSPGDDASVPGEGGGSGSDAMTGSDGSPGPAACLTSGTYTTRPASTHRYRVTATLDRDGAADACAADGAHLAVIDDTGENAYVRSIANDVWIGFDDLTAEGTFRWVNGAPVSFTAWAGGEPNNSFGREDCAYLTPDTTPHWNDTNCGDVRAAVCECEPGYTAPPTPACRTMPAGSTTADGRRYFLRSTGKNWDDARADCASIGAYLIAISDAEENQLVENTLAIDAAATSWIGLSDLQTAGTWAWLDGAPSGYTNWTTSAPYPGSGQDCVALQLNDQRWANLSCSAVLSYVCECDPDPP